MTPTLRFGATGLRWCPRVIKALDDQKQLMVGILYGTGLRLFELLRLRVKDVDFDNGSLLVRCGKGMKDRITVLRDSVREPLEAHIASVRLLRERDVNRGGGYVELPYALGRKLLGAPRDWPWQWEFPARRQYVDINTGQLRRHQDNPGASRGRRCEYDHDLHARAEQGWSRGVVRLTDWGEGWKMRGVFCGVERLRLRRLQYKMEQLDA